MIKAWSGTDPASSTQKLMVNILNALSGTDLFRQSITVFIIARQNYAGKKIPDPGIMAIGKIIPEMGKIRC